MDLHLLGLDGVYAERDDGALTFVAHPELTASEVAKVLEEFVGRLRTLFAKRGYLSDDMDPQRVLDDEALRDRELVRCGVTGAPPAGPMRRVRVLTLSGMHAAARVTSELCVEHAGFSLHAQTRIAGDDAEGREALIKYMLRPPLANHRLTHLPDGLVRLALKKKFSDGTSAVEMDPLSLLMRLAASVPPPRMHTLRYQGVLASRSRFRSRIVRRRVDVAPGEKPPPRRHHMPYAELMRRTFRIDVEACGHCGARMKLIALVKDPRGITRFLRHLGLPTEPPTRAPPRDEPYWQSVVMRRKAMQGQLEMFAA